MYLIRIFSKFKIFEISNGKLENSHFNRLPTQLILYIAALYKSHDITILLNMLTMNLTNFFKGIYIE